MNDDPRLLAWLAAAERALAAAPEQLAEAAATLVAEREPLMRSLEAAPPAAPSPELAARLARADRALDERLGALHAKLRSDLDDVRRARGALAGYRPARANLPAFVSRSV
jgi:hypothetical protein